MGLNRPSNAEVVDGGSKSETDFLFGLPTPQILLLMLDCKTVFLLYLSYIVFVAFYIYILAYIYECI